MSTTKTNESEFLTTKQAASYLSIKPNTLEVWRVQGRGPTFAQFGRAIRYRVSDLENYALACTRRSTSEYEQRAAGV